MKEDNKKKVVEEKKTHKDKKIVDEEKADKKVDNEVKENNNHSGSKQRSKKPIIVILLLAIVIGLCICYFIFDKGKSSEKAKVNNTSKYSAYRLTDNSLQDFDLYFLQLENEKKNKIYSPLSIKYALEMLGEGANGETKKQISDIIGTYSAKKYTNDKHMSFANGLFVKDTFKDTIKDSYVNTLTNKYNAEVVYDSFKTPDVLNNWISNKTFKLINNVADDISEHDFILTNALAIDMEWIKKIQSVNQDYRVIFKHEDYAKYISSLNSSYYRQLDFKDVSYKTMAAEIGAVANRYDIINEVGEDTIRDTITKKYQEWLDKGGTRAECSWDTETVDVDAKTYVDQYIRDIGEGYKHVSSSTDFKFYNDDDVKVFAKDLTEYNGTTLQYVGIMPKEESLDSYVENIKAKNVNDLIDNLKNVELNSFKDGVITEVYGSIPMFKFDYELKLMDDLGKLGITNVFDQNKADLSNLTSEKAYINRAEHKANIDFSNDGIKAAAATVVGGKGGGDCGFEYLYKVPVEKIDLTFDKPYMFIIRDKASGEIWFAGTVYEPLQFTNEYEQMVSN